MDRDLYERLRKMKIFKGLPPPNVKKWIETTTIDNTYPIKNEKPSDAYVLNVISDGKIAATFDLHCSEFGDITQGLKVIVYSSNDGYRGGFAVNALQVILDTENNTLKSNIIYISGLGYDVNGELVNEAEYMYSKTFTLAENGIGLKTHFVTINGTLLRGEAFDFLPDAISVQLIHV